MLHTRSTGGLFNLSRLRAKTKTISVLVREILYADDAALVAHSEITSKTCANVSLRPAMTSV